MKIDISCVKKLNKENEADIQYWLKRGWEVDDVYFCFHCFFFYSKGWNTSFCLLTSHDVSVCIVFNYQSDLNHRKSCLTGVLLLVYSIYV